MRGRSNAFVSGSLNSIGFLENSDSPALQGLGSFLEWPEEPVGLSLYSRWIPEKPDHGKWYLNLSYQFTDSFRAGVDYRPLTEDLGLLMNWRVFSENEHWRPALVLGTSNDDFGGINSQAFFATLSKHLWTVSNLDISAYGGTTYIESLREFRPVGGLHFRRDAWTAMLMYSGRDEHVTLSRQLGNHTVSVLLFDLKLPGIAYGFNF